MEMVAVARAEGFTAWAALPLRLKLLGLAGTVFLVELALRHFARDSRAYARWTALFTAVNRQGVVFLWPVRLPGPANDFTNILQQAPALENAARPAFAHSIAALQQSTPVLKFIRPYTPEFVGWLRDFGQVAAPYDANGHYARISPAFNNYQYKETPSGPQLTPTNPVDDKLTGYQTGITNRCPGSASQAPTDGSAPWPDTGGTLDCNPNLVPPGP